MHASNVAVAIISHSPQKLGIHLFLHLELARQLNHMEELLPFLTGLYGDDSSTRGFSGLELR